MTVILLAVTILYNVGMNRYFRPLEEFLPTDVSDEGEDEQTPLLASAEEGRGETHIERLGQAAHIPSQVVDPVARFLRPSVFASRKAMKAWLEDGEFDEEDVPEYTEDQIKNAYVNPAFTSQTPLLWLPRDDTGVAKAEIRECESAGLKVSDQGAWIDVKGKLRWSELNFDEVPIFKKSVKY
jgi:calcium permeable stress-gated cation channel